MACLRREEGYSVSSHENMCWCTKQRSAWAKEWHFISTAEEFHDHALIQRWKSGGDTVLLMSAALLTTDIDISHIAADVAAAFTEETSKPTV